MVHTLAIDSVIKSYNKKIILSDVYLSCKTHDIVGLFGRNGEGKSTLLKIIFGTESAENKFIMIDNVVFNKPFLVKNAITYLPQQSFLPKNSTIKKVVSLWVNQDAQNSFYDDEMLALKNQKISTLSGGELRFLEIKLLLFSEAKFCLLDEPFMGLSPLQIEKVKHLIVHSSKNKGILLTDHDYKNVLGISNKNYLVKNRKCHLLNTISELVDHGYVSG